MTTEQNHIEEEIEITADASEKSHRRIYKLADVPKRLLKLFLFLFIIHPTVYFILVAAAIGITKFLSIGKIIIILAPPIIATFTIIFILLNKKLSKIIDRLLNEPAKDELPEIEEFINRFPFRSALPLFIGCAGGPVLTGIIGLVTNVFISVAQVLFIIIIGEITALVVAYTLFYYGKVFLYPSNREITFNPLSIFHKFSIPILSFILVIFTIMSIFLYRIIETDINTFRNNLMTKTLANTTNQYNAFLRNSLTEIESYAKTDLF
jgi:hypothetical protein